MTSDPKIWALAATTGVLPALLWLWFWLREDRPHPEPKRMLFACFLSGMLSVAFVLPLETFIQHQVEAYKWRIIAWASIEEILKFLAAFIVLYKSGEADEPIDWPIYLITVSLGFAAF